MLIVKKRERMDAGESGFRGLSVRPASSEHLQPQGDRNGVFPDHYSNPIFLSIALITAGYFFLRGGALE